MKTETKIKIWKVCFTVFAIVWPLVTLALWKFGMGMDYCTKGLVFNVIGVVITFLFPFPAPGDGTGISIGLELGTELQFEGERMTVENIMQLQENKNKWRSRWAFLGLMYLLAGLAFQIAYQVVPNY